MLVRESESFAMRVALPLLLIATSVTGCAHRTALPIVVEPVVAPLPAGTSLAWREVARTGDIERIASLGIRYAALLGDRGDASLRAEAHKARPDPTPGVYNCRITRLGIGQTVGKATAHRSFLCYVGDDGNFLTLTKSTGSERPGGRLWRDTGDRMVFLGGVPAADKTTPNAYGADTATDRVGIFERIGEFRWRLIFDAPRPGIAFDVLEMTPTPVSLAALR
jgi:hypothetical protein